ncbi:surfeit locus protein [Geranomyces variabilis]|uniref:Surfeit locus protein n=1 Tax=Geranomyces variabilis TaxID=109894 RepID=A0AAD5TGA0_9FUNG|nr:surfeit locus protein [Geranomyces variabilis]
MAHAMAQAPPAPYSLDSLQARLAAHQKCFDSLVELIPPKYYFPSDVDADLAGKHLHNKKNKAPKQAVKDATKKAKKHKLDPESSTSVLDIQSDHLKAAAGSKPNGKAAAPAASASIPLGLVTALPSGSIVELQAKLKSRIDELRAKRKAPPTDGDAAPEQQPRSRQEILQIRADRKRQRKESMKAKKEKRRKLDDTMGMSTTPKSEVGSVTGKKRSADEVTEDVSFGKLDFGVTEPSKKRKGPTDIAGQLKQAEAKKMKLEKLKETAPEKAAHIEESATWNKLLKQAEGEKVKDDVKLLKKSVKRKDQAKAKSGTAWADRKASEKKAIDDRLKKREENIKARLEQRNAPKGSKKKEAPKKKRPGFEGGGGRKKPAK